MYSEEDQAMIASNPNLSLPERMRLLGVKDAAGFRELRAALPAHRAIAVEDIPSKGAVTAWNPPRERGYSAYREQIYGYRTDTLKKKFGYCRDFAGNRGAGFLQSGIKLEAAFACTGFSHVVADHSRSQNYFDDFAKLFNIRHKLYQAFKNLITYDNILVYWKKEWGVKDGWRGKKFSEFTVKPLDEVTVDYIGTINDTTDDGNLVYLDIDKAHKERILKLERSRNEEERRIAHDFRLQFPKLYRLYQSYGEDKYLLSNRDGEFWAVINRDKDGMGLQEPSMEVIFPSIEIWKSLEEGDLVIASIIKKLIVLITLGETLSHNQTLPGYLGIDDLPNAGWAREKDYENIKTALARRFGQIVYLFAPHHAKIDYKFPDPQVLGSEKYTHALFNILSWLCVGQQFIVGDGGKFQAGEINKVGLTANLVDMREFLASEWTKKVYGHRTININSYPVPDAVFDKDVLKAPKEVREDIKMDVMLGLDLGTALTRRGYDLGVAMERRKYEREEYGDLLKNITDFAGNVSDIPAAGRPPDGDPSELENPVRREDER